MNKSRKIGFEYLRIISMVLIVGNHFLLYTGVLDSVKPFTINYYILWLLEAIGYVGVDCYVLISGYFLIMSKFSWKKVLKLIGEVWFYSVVILICLMVTKQDIYSKRQIFNALLPVTTRQYWFVTDYIILYILSPFINMGLQNLSQKQFKKLLVILVSVFSIWDIFPGEQIGVQKGYSLYWLIAVYSIGAYIRLYTSVWGKKTWKILYVFCVISMLESKIIISACAQIIPGLESYSNIFYGHSSLFVIGAAVALFMIFKDKQNKETRVENWILKISSLTFGAYLIHMNANLAKIYWGQLKNNVNANSVSVFLIYIISTVVVFSISIGFDSIRNIGEKQIKKIVIRRQE